jgi:hypothetical protein
MVPLVHVIGISAAVIGWSPPDGELLPPNLFVSHIKSTVQLLPDKHAC